MCYRPEQNSANNLLSNGNGGAKYEGSVASGRKCEICGMEDREHDGLDINDNC